MFLRARVTFKDTNCKNKANRKKPHKMLKIHHNHSSSEFNVIKVFLLITLYSSLMPTCLLKTKMVHGKHFVIHVPMKIRTHHHTHTVFTQVHGVGKDTSGAGGGGYGAGKASKQTIYKIMGYSTHHTGLTAGGGAGGGKAHHHRHNGRSHGYRHNRGVGSSSDYGEINYDDYLNCDSSLPQPNGGDMIFNHFSRQDEEDYPDVEEVIDEEMGDEWE